MRSHEKHDEEVVERSHTNVFFAELERFMEAWSLFESRCCGFGLSLEIKHNVNSLSTSYSSSAATQVEFLADGGNFVFVTVI